MNDKVPQVAKQEKANKYRFVFGDGELKDVATDLNLNDAVICEYANRLRQNKNAKFCMIFARDKGEWKPTKLNIATIQIGCL